VVGGVDSIFALEVLPSHPLKQCITQRTELLLASKPDAYGGVIVDHTALPADASQFKAALKDSLRVGKRRDKLVCAFTFAYMLVHGHRRFFNEFIISDA